MSDNEELLARYRRAQQRRGRSVETMRTSGYRLRSLARFLDEQGRTLLDASRADVEAWLDTFDVAPQTRAWQISMIAGFYKWALRDEVTDRDPTAAIDRPQVPETLPRPASDADLATGLQLADDRMRCWILLGCLASMRAGEIARMRREHILDTWIPPSIFIPHGKGKRDRYVPLHDDLAAALRAYGMPRKGPVWLGKRGPLTAKTIVRYVSRFWRSIGVEVTSHQHRHWFGTNALDQSEDLRAVQELMGHASSKTTEIYTRVRQGKKTDIVNGLHIGPENAKRPPPGDPDGGAPHGSAQARLANDDHHDGGV